MASVASVCDFMFSHMRREVLSKQIGILRIDLFTFRIYSKGLVTQCGIGDFPSIT